MPGNSGIMFHINHNQEKNITLIISKVLRVPMETYSLEGVVSRS